MNRFPSIRAWLDSSAVGYEGASVVRGRGDHLGEEAVLIPHSQSKTKPHFDSFEDKRSRGLPTLKKFQWINWVLAGIFCTPALGQLREISPARELIFSSGFQVVSETKPGAEVKEAKPAGTRATVKAIYIGGDGETYYISDWSWVRRQAGKSHFWIRPNQTNSAGLGESVDQDYSEVQEMAFPEGYKVLNEQGVVVKSVDGPTTANIKAIRTAGNGMIYYLTDWSWEQIQKGKKPNWIVSIEGSVSGGGADAETDQSRADIVFEAMVRFDTEKDSMGVEEIIQESWLEGDWAQAADYFSDGHDFRRDWLEAVAAVAVQKGEARNLIERIDLINARHRDQAKVYDLDGMSHEALCERQSIESNNRFVGILAMRLGDYAEVIRRNLPVAEDQSKLGFQGSGRRINATREVARALWRLGKTDEATVATRRWLNAVALDLAARILHPNYLSSFEVIHQSNPENEPIGGYFELLGDITEPQIAAEVLVCLKGMQLTAASFQHTTLAELRDPEVAAETAELKELLDRAQKLALQGDSLDENSARRTEEIHARLAFRKLNRAVVNLGDSAQRSRKQSELVALSKEEEELQSVVSGDTDWVRLAKVQEEIFRLASEIDQMTTEFAMKEGRFIPSPSEVIGRLEPGELLLDFFHTGNLTDRSGEMGRYGVLIFSPDRPLRKVDLGPASEVNAEISTLHLMMTRPGPVDRRDDELREVLTRIHTAVLAPIWQELASAEKVIVSADAELTLLPFDCLLDGDGQFAGEKCFFSYVNSSRDLLREAPSEWIWRDTNAVIIGNPNYASVNPAVASLEGHSTRVGANSGNSAETEELAGFFGKARIRALPGTQKEADVVSEVLTEKGASVICLTGDRASESMVVSTVASPEILHVATHGFFFGGSKSVDSFDRGLFGPNDVLLRAGIVLAGAQSSLDGWRSGNFPDTSNDGILTAAEILRLDLGSTRLVVLSACQTGLGQLAGGESVTGLRSAIHVAGAHNVALTLWDIPDLDTVSMMNDFYESVASGKKISLSFAEAKRAHLRRLVDSSGLWTGIKRAGAFILTESR